MTEQMNTFEAIELFLNITTPTWLKMECIDIIEANRNDMNGVILTIVSYLKHKYGAEEVVLELDELDYMFVIDQRWLITLSKSFVKTLEHTDELYTFCELLSDSTKDGEEVNQ